MSSFPVVALITSKAWSPTVQFTLKLGALPGCLASALLIPGAEHKRSRPTRRTPGLKSLLNEENLTSREQKGLVLNVSKGFSFTPGSVCYMSHVKLSDV